MYGTVDGVAALSAMWSDNGHFYDEDVYQRPTVPSLSQVEEWLAQVSASLDVALAIYGFVVPITVAAVLPSLDQKVNGIVRDLVDYSHGAGRFFTTQSIESGVSPFAAIEKELRDWVAESAYGFEALGCLRNREYPGKNTVGLWVM
jgi:hypothetical protein